MTQWNPETLTRLLAELAALGQLSLRKMEDGTWCAGVEFPAPEGITAKVSSGFKHTCPISALQCVHDRLGGLRDMLTVPSPVPSLKLITVNGD